MTQRIIEDHKPLVEDLNITGQELMEICTDEDASDIKEDVDNIIAKYDDVKVGVRDKLTQLESTLRTVSTEVRSAKNQFKFKLTTNLIQGCIQTKKSKVKYII